MQTYYMIDYENTGVAGLKGNQNLAEQDQILLFFSMNCCKLDLRELATCGSPYLKVIEIPAGNQSLDMHISSYIGYFSHKHKLDGCQLVVISKDRGYESVIKHWISEQIRICSYPSIEDYLHDALQLPKEKADAEDKSVFSEAPEETESVKESAVKSKQGKPNEEAALKTKNNNAIMQTLVKAGYDQKLSGTIASICSKTYGEKNRKQLTYRSIISALGQKQGLPAYNSIKMYL